MVVQGLRQPVEAVQTDVYGRAQETALYGRNQKFHRVTGIGPPGRNHKAGIAVAWMQDPKHTGHKISQCARVCMVGSLWKDSRAQGGEPVIDDPSHHRKLAYRGAFAWNGLPATVRVDTSYLSFKKVLKQHC
ncbi:hypothetical protein Bbelb_019970 [Branchiostoma belcheri]|nr:hypothetical protein Bbelb_019970 [Branchiostoma belcheri]